MDKLSITMQSIDIDFKLLNMLYTETEKQKRCGNYASAALAYTQIHDIYKDWSKL